MYYIPITIQNRSRIKMLTFTMLVPNIVNYYTITYFLIEKKKLYFKTKAYYHIVFFFEHFWSIVEFIV